MPKKIVVFHYIMSGVIGVSFADKWRYSVHMKYFVIVLVLAVAPFYLMAQEDSVQYVIPSTTPASLDMYKAPEGFVDGKSFNGYIHPLTQTTVVLTLIENLNYINMKKSIAELNQEKAQNEMLLAQEQHKLQRLDNRIRY